MSGVEVEEASSLTDILCSDLAEESFVAGLVGNVEDVATLVPRKAPVSPRPTSSPRSSAKNKKSSRLSFFGGSSSRREAVKKISCTWEEIERSSSQRRELAKVVERRLNKSIEECSRALKEVNGAPELRAALRAVLISCKSAADADTERRSRDDETDSALAALGRPIQIGDDDAWTASTQLEAACARARAEGRAEALAALSERERLREKCNLYKERILELERELEDARSLKDVPLEDLSAEEAKELREQLALTERRLSAFTGTQRHLRLLELENELEERGHIITALREALDVDNRHNKAPATPPPVRASPLLSSLSVVSDPSAFDDSDDDNISPRAERHGGSPRTELNGHATNGHAVAEEKHGSEEPPGVEALEIQRGGGQKESATTKKSHADVLMISSGTFVV